MGNWRRLGADVYDEGGLEGGEGRGRGDGKIGRSVDGCRRHDDH